MPTYTLIMPAVVVGSGGAATISFSSIPSTYTDLVLLISARTTQTGTGFPWSSPRIAFNGVTTNQSDRYIYGDGGTAYSGSGSAINAAFGANSGDATASTFANFYGYIPNYAGSTFKSMSQDSVAENNATLAGTILDAALWSSTAAITSITLTPSSGSFAQHSTAYLYGVSNA